MACKYCGKVVTLIPSARARAAHYGGDMTTADYVKLFPNHARCEVAARSAQAVDTMRRAVERNANNGS